MDKQYFYILLFQTARKTVLVLVAPAVLLLKNLEAEALALFFFFHGNPKITFGEGGMAFAFYFKFSDEIGTDQYALILFSVLACHEVPQTNHRHVSTLLGICCFLKNGF